MKKFSEWILIKEELQSKDIDAMFADLERQISSYFDTLYNSMKQSFGKGNAFSDRFRRDMIADLTSLINRLKGEAPQQQVDWVVSEANSDILSGLRAVRTNPDTGRSQFHVKDVLDNIKNRILANVQKVKDAIVNNQVQSLKGDISKVHKDVRGIQSTLKSPPMTRQESMDADEVIDGLQKLRRQMPSGTNVTLIAPDHSEIMIGQKDWKANILNNRNYSVRIDSPSGTFSVPLNIVNKDNFYNVTRSKIMKKLGMTDLSPEIGATAPEDITSIGPEQGLARGLAGLGGSKTTRERRQKKSQQVQPGNEPGYVRKPSGGVQ